MERDGRGMSCQLGKRVRGYEGKRVRGPGGVIMI